MVIQTEVYIHGMSRKGMLVPFPTAHETEPINYNPLPRGIHGKTNGTSGLCVGIAGGENDSGE
jgi:hypothetical protein